MSYLLKKMRRDLWKLRGQFMAVLLMTLLSIMVFSGIEGLWKSMEINSAQYFKDTNLAAAWINGISFTDKDLEIVKNIEGVQDADLLTMLDGISTFNKQDAEFKILTYNSNNVSKLYVVEGISYNENEEGCWLDSFYADAMNIKVGDRITIESDGNGIETEIVGIVMNPEYIGYTGPASTTPTDHKSYGYAVVDNGTFDKLLGSERIYNQIRVKYEDRVDADEIRKQINDELGNKMLSYINEETNSNIVYFTSKISQVKQISFLFSAIFFLLALLTIYSTISRLVSTQNVQIGTFSAMGFLRKQILFHYAIYGFFISLVGVLIGYSLSHFVSDMLISSQQKFHALPTWQLPISGTSLGLMVIIVIVCTIAALSASYKYVAKNPAVTMKNDLMIKSSKKTSRNIGFLSFEWKWVLRDLQRTKLRFLIGIIGVLGSVVLLISALGLRDSVEYSNKYVYGQQFSYSTKLGVKSTADLDSIEVLDSNGQWLNETTAEIRLKDQIETTNLNIVDQGEYITLWSGQGTDFADEEIIIAKKLADRLNIKENDRIEIKVLGAEEFEEYTITKIVEIPFPQGIYCSKAYWEEQGKDFIPNFFLTKENLSKDSHDDFVSQVTIEEQLVSTNEIMKSVYAILSAMIAASIVLSIVILYNLGLLSYTEKIQQYATLKVLGFKNMELFKIIFYNSLPSLLIGCLIGLIIGRKIMKVFVTLVSTNVRGYLSHLTAVNIIFSLLLVLICTLIVDFIVYKKVKKLDMTESLKNIE